MRTSIFFRNKDHHENFIERTEVKYDAEDITFTGIAKVHEADELEKIGRTQIGRVCEYYFTIEEFCGNNYLIFTSGNCSLEGFHFLIGEGENYNMEYFKLLRAKDFTPGIYDLYEIKTLLHRALKQIWIMVFPKTSKLFSKL